MKRQYITKKKLPDTPGIYIFKDYQKRPLYIGRATSLRDRVKSYFSADVISTRGPRIVDMVTKAVSLDIEQTDSVLEAIILESALIKKYQPHYNVDERDDKSSYYVVITDDVWPRVFLARARDLDQEIKEKTLEYPIKKIFGPYPHSALIKEALKIVRKMFPFKDKKSFDARHDAFYQALGRSPKESDLNAQRRYQRTIDNLILFFEGKKDILRKNIEREMNGAAKEMRFEEAGQVKRLLYALDHINDIALIKEEGKKEKALPAGRQGKGKTSQVRIEAYDIAHVSGTSVVGAFTVIIDGERVPSEYRKFILSRQVNDDVANLGEILNRRLNHTEWTYPDIIV
ncbi:MAG: GIY-YIG nuclease family protein, partial [Candidatus Taylorbacteria bacterium]